MTVECPTCGYAFEPADGLACPRCGEAIDCSAVGCSDCAACANPVAMLRTRLAGRVSGRDDERD